jgi:hypothetical protein
VLHRVRACAELILHISLLRRLVGAVGIELKATLKTRKLLILLNEKNAKNVIFAQARYTPGTRISKAAGKEVGPA